MAISNHIATRIYCPSRVPDRIPGIVFVACGIVLEQVHLDAERIDEELEGAQVIVEWIDDDADKIVIVGTVAVTQPCADLPRLRVLGVEREVKRVGVVGQQHTGADRRRLVLSRSRLELELKHQRIAPRGIIEPAIDGRRGRSARHAWRVRIMVCRLGSQRCQHRRQHEQASERHGTPFHQTVAL